VSPSDAETEDDNIVELLQKVSPFDVETEDDNVVELRQKMLPSHAEIKDEKDSDLEYYMGLFQRSMHGLHSSIHELEHYVHKIDKLVKQKLTPKHPSEAKADP
jgi:hypothetical protein